ncbi:hypothetical protein [Mucilaginibacter sp. CSA2-8R]|uniref:hypothetical protein n=1 Tax=Mucilaginibacter sp. CSA2-8R TaxID=3141542 RepID=UPI00315C731E
MDSKVKQFIESGILESYFTGSATAEEEQEVFSMKQQYPEVQQEFKLLEQDMLKLADWMAVPPPPGLWNRIEADINEVTLRTPQQPQPYRDYSQNRQHSAPQQPGYIEVDAQNTHIRVHKVWRWVFAAVFILGKIFLATAIYFYLENRQAQEDIQELKQQLHQIQQVKPR